MILKDFMLTYGNTTYIICASLEDYKPVQAKVKFSEHENIQGLSLIQKIGVMRAVGELEGYVDNDIADAIHSWYLNGNICTFRDCYNKSFSVIIKDCNSLPDTVAQKKIFIQMVVI